ncbi:MAG TPA: hypothetical protein PKY96_02620 [Flavobacteriales bacterium]|nr:hypothetical protein [Flavobacteriales bacterium]
MNNTAPKVFGLVLLAVMLSHYASAQTTWRRSFGGSGSDNGSNIISCASGGFLVVGWTSSFGNGSSDLYLLRLNEDGGILWSRFLGGPDVDQAVACAEVDGGFILACTVGDGDNGSYDMRVVRTDAAGNQQWSADFGGPDWDICRGVEVLDDGLLLFGVTYNDAAPQGAGIAFRMSMDGVVFWSYLYEAPVYSEFSGAARSNDGLALVGHLHNDEGDDDGLLVLLDAAGQPQWDRVWSGEEDVGFSGIATGDEIPFVICGRSRIGSQPQKIMLCGYDVDGGFLWDQYIGNEGDAAATAIKRAHESGFVVTGYVTISSGVDMLLTRVNEFGWFITGSNYGDGNRATGCGLDTVPGGGYVVAGWIEGSGPGPRAVFVVKTNDDCFTATNTVTGTFDEVGVEDAIVLSEQIVQPNPVLSGELVMVTAVPFSREWCLFASDGSLVQQRRLLPGESRLSVPVVQPGLYHLVFTYGDGRRVGTRLVIE